MDPLLTLIRPQPAASAVPLRFPSPFAQGPPTALAACAAVALQQDLERGPWAEEFYRPGGGKMLGVLLVARSDGAVGFLRGFSGMLGGRWLVDGFVPPVFDPDALSRFWPAGQAKLAEFDRRWRILSAGDAAHAVRAQLATMIARHASAAATLADSHRLRRAARHAARAILDRGPTPTEATLAQESRTDAAAARRLAAAHAEARAPLAARVHALDDELAQLAQHRATRSHDLQRQLHDAYSIVNARGERRDLAALFAPRTPPSGAGDCVAPKLLHHAYAHRLRPLAVAEFWWGAPPPTGGRVPGVFYPACRGKCGPILAHMLDGLPTDPAPTFGDTPVAADEPHIVFEDAWLLVVNKPCGLLSVPGRSGALRDSVQVRLQQRYPTATGPLVVHRLDLDTSGLLLVAKDDVTHAALQRQFARREITKRYTAWLDGTIAKETGRIDLALRSDLDDRPRQIVDPIGGRAAITDWRVLARANHRTRVALWPHTGRTHQLRVHAAHPDGLSAAIVGDRLYGRAGDRLLLHAESLAFAHPHTGARIELERAAPF